MMIRLEMEPQAEAELTKRVEKDSAAAAGAKLLLGQIALFRGRLDEAVTLTERELASIPANAMALSQLGDALRAAVEVGRSDRRAAEIDLAEPVLQRALHPARQGVHEEASSPRRPKACCAAPSSTTRTTAPRTTCSPSCCSRSGANRGSETRVRDRGDGCRGSPRRAMRLAGGCRLSCGGRLLARRRHRAASQTPSRLAVAGPLHRRRRAGRAHASEHLRRTRSQAVHHRDQRLRRRARRLRPRRLARRAGAERHAARGRQAARRRLVQPADRRRPAGSIATATTAPSRT